jgi:hypothetical protein
MPTRASYTDALKIYDGAIDDLSARVVQDRELHTHDMAHIYMRAVSDDMHGGYLSTLEKAIGERARYGHRKDIMDAADLATHERKVGASLSGGGDPLHAMTYAVKRGWSCPPTPSLTPPQRACQARQVGI